MRFKTILVSTFVVAAAFGPRAFGAVSVLEENAGRLTVRVAFGSDATPAAGVRTLDLPGKPELRFERFFVALPPGASAHARQAGGSYVDDAELPPLRGPREHEAEPAPLPPGLYPANPVVVSEPFVFRKTRVVAIDCYASQADYSSGIHRAWSDYDVVVDYPGRSSTSLNREGAPDPMLASVVLNTPVGPGGTALRLGARAVPDPHFSLSEYWIKIRIVDPGVYAITGSDLIAMGVNLTTMIADPASFRLFTGGGRAQSRSLASGDGTYAPGIWAQECDIVVDYGGDGSFDPGDRIIFYALGSRGFEDLYQPGAPRDEFYDHPFAKENVYYLTWDSNFPGQPARMNAAAANPVPGADVTTYEERLYFEENRVSDYTFGGDGWLWLEVGEGTGSQTFPVSKFTVRDLDVTEPQTFRTVALARPKANVNNSNHHARYLINNNLVAEQVWNTGGAYGYDQATPVVATGMFLQEGRDSLDLNVPRDLNTNDFMYFAWYSIFYHRTISAVNDAILFASPDTVGTVNYAVTGFATSGPRYAYDVSDPFHPVQLTGGSESATGLRFSANVGVNRRAYYWACSDAGFLRPLAMARHFPRDLRAGTTSPHMTIITDPSFTSAAQILRSYRLQNLPLISSPRVDVVTTTEIFDNFSGGQKDPMGIRNYIKFLYDNYAEPGGGPSLTYVLLLGDANVDYKNNRNQQPDRVPSNLNLNPVIFEAYVTDDWYALLDTLDTPGKGIMDVAIGRLPAATFSEAEFLARKTIDYEREAEFGNWRDRVILVADDEISHNTTTQKIFVQSSEDLANTFMASYLEAKKLYLTEFPAIQRIKPGSRLQFIQDWNEGALVINYVGHGSSVQMADEQVFVVEDVGKLNNGLKLPLFMAFSCTIGNFTSETRSLSERLLLRQTGGVVATVTGSELTTIGPNDELDRRIIRDMFPPAPGAPVPLGIAVINAKMEVVALPTIPSESYEQNNQKYNLLGDPALQLLSPRRSIEFDASDVDTLTTGKRQVVRGRVLNTGGQTDVSFSGTVSLLVRETDDESGYVRESDGFTIPYRYPGGIIYKGTADVTAGTFEFSFKVPRYAETGDKGFVLAYANDGAGDAVAEDYSVVVRKPEPGDPGAVPADGPPRIDMGFKTGQRVVKPGAVLQATVRDADGVNILGTTPEGKLGLVFDNTALPVDATGYFEYDHGGIDTSGTLVYPLPDLAVGEHRAIVKVSDAFGQTSLDTLVFSMTDPLDYAATVVMNYPNPFENETHFLISLTDPARIRLGLFTLSGKRVRTLEATKGAGDQWITWDGRDNFGGSVANGTYLYVARVEFVGLDRPAVVLRGKVVRIK